MEVSVFASRLRAILKKKEMSVYALAKKAGIASQMIYRFQSGEREPTWRSAVAIADALGVSLDEFRAKGKK